MLRDNTPEAVQAHLADIDELDVGDFHQPSSLDAETTVIAKALFEVT